MHIEELVAEWQIADATLKAAKERFDKVTNELAQHMLVNEIKSDLVCVRGEDYKVTVVAAESTSVDSEGLKKAMGAVAYRKVCKSRVDTKLLETAIRDGVVSAETVASYVTIKNNTPYVRVTTVTGD
jgi:hypothetical protein